MAVFLCMPHFVSIPLSPYNPGSTRISPPKSMALICLDQRSRGDCWVYEVIADTRLKELVESTNLKYKQIAKVSVWYYDCR